jgi:hypothetical protein
MSINPIVYRLGVKTEWFFKFINNKTSDLDNSNHCISEVVYFVNLFFKKYGLQIDSLKLCYTKYNLKLFITYNLIVLTYKKPSRFTKLKRSITISFKGLVINDYLKYKYLTVLFKNIGTNNNKFINKSLIYNRIHIMSIIGLLKLKYFNLKQAFFVNFFIGKFIVIMKLFLDYKKSVTVVLKQLFKNIDSTIFYHICKHHLISNIIRLRKFDWLASYKIVLNIVYSSLKLTNRTKALSNILSLKLPSIKNLKYIGIFLKFIETLCILFLIRLGFILGFKTFLIGNMTKNQRATQSTITIGQCINNSKINANIYYNKSVCFTANGTLGLKVYIKGVELFKNYKNR